MKFAATIEYVTDKERVESIRPAHRQYLRGFVPQKNDGKSHKLDVRVKGEGLTARARKSYVAAR